MATLGRRRFGKQDFVYLSDEDVYRCPAGEKLAYRYTNEENGLVLRRYWTNTCQSCSIKQRCTTGKERRITPQLANIACQAKEVLGVDELEAVADRG